MMPNQRMKCASRYADRRRMAKEKNSDDCLLPRSCLDSRQLRRKSEVPKLLHSQPARAAGSASLQKTPMLTLAIREFSAPTYLRQGAIAYKTSPEQIGFYAYHRWATDPRDVRDQLGN